MWPYPAGSADCVDRANCAGEFLRTYPGYRVLTPYGLGEQAGSALLADADLVVFAPFETLTGELSVHGTNLRYRGRIVDAVMSELTPGYLWRHGVLPLDPQQPTWDLRTHLVNGSLIAAHKGHQSTIFADYARNHDDIVAADHVVADTVEQVEAALVRILENARAAVIRPFSASQGTGVVFVDRSQVTQGSGPDAAAWAVARVHSALVSKYGGPNPFPLIVSAFAEAARIDGCVTDVRIFVVYDPTAGGVRGIPGMVRRAQLPLRDDQPVTDAAALTNLNAPAAPGALPGARFFPATAARVLEQLGLTADKLAALCGHAAALWAHAFADAGPGRQFAYGSADFIVGDGGQTIPVELNGANVGSHPTVHPRWSGSFGAATTHALTQLGMAR